MKGPKQWHPWTPVVQPEGFSADQELAPEVAQLIIAAQKEAAVQTAIRTSAALQQAEHDVKVRGPDPVKERARRDSMVAAAAMTTSGPSWDGGGPGLKEGGEGEAAPHRRTGDKFSIKDVGKFMRRQSVTGKLPPSLLAPSHLLSDSEARAKAAAELGVREQSALDMIEARHEEYVQEKLETQGQGTAGVSKKDKRRASILGAQPSS